MYISSLFTIALAVISAVIMVDAYITKQSHTSGFYGSEKVLDGDPDTCMDTGFNRGAWWMRTWDTPQTFQYINLIVQPGLQYYEIHASEYSTPYNHPQITDSSFCARIGTELADQTNITIRCVNTKVNVTELNIQLVGPEWGLKLCEVNLFDDLASI